MAPGGPKVGNDGVAPARLGTVAVSVCTWAPRARSSSSYSDGVREGDTVGSAEPLEERQRTVGQVWRSVLPAAMD